MAAGVAWTGAVPPIHAKLEEIRWRIEKMKKLNLGLICALVLSALIVLFPSAARSADRQKEAQPEEVVRPLFLRTVFFCYLPRAHASVSRGLSRFF